MLVVMRVYVCMSPPQFAHKLQTATAAEAEPDLVALSAIQGTAFLLPPPGFACCQFYCNVCVEARVVSPFCGPEIAALALRAVFCVCLRDPCVSELRCAVGCTQAKEAVEAYISALEGAKAWGVVVLAIRFCSV